jgi:hypothetical protein
MKTGAQIVTLATAILALVVGCAAPMDPALRAFQMNPFPPSSPEAEQLKYPPGGGVGAYWLDGRFDVTLDVLVDESIEGDKALLAELVCFRQEGQRVYAKNKSGQLLVLDLSTTTFKKSPEINDFPPQDQAVLQRLATKSRGNIYINPTTLMPEL